MPGAVLLPYQQRWLADTNPVKVWEKSRRIGASWCDAAESALLAARKKTAGGMNCWYIGYSKDMAQEYIDDVAAWAKQYHNIAVKIEREVLEEEDKAIQVFKVRFASGHKVSALSSRPTSLRGKQGKITLDEAAFHHDLKGLLKAALAFLMWGGRVNILSTHDGVDNPFNELIEDIRAGKLPYSLHRTTFDDALAEGLCERIFLVTEQYWSPAAQEKWRKEIRTRYGDDAEEELDCIPASGGGAYLNRVLIESCMDDALPVVRWLPPAKDFVDWPQDTAEREVYAWCQKHLGPLLERLPKNQRHFFGEDFGRSGDLTVIWPLTQQPDLSLPAPFVLELRDAPFRTQKQMLLFLVKRLPRFSGGALDARGNGQYLAEAARQEFGPDFIEEVMLSRGWYLEHMPRMKAHFEDRTHRLPKDAALLDDLRGLRLIDGVAKPPATKGKDASGQRHCDAAVACALAMFAEATIEAPEPWEPVSQPRNYLNRMMKGY